MKKFIKIAALLLIVLVVIFAVVFFGNPVSKMLVKKSATDFIEENHSKSDYYVESVNYDFKTGGYYAIVESPSSADSSFTVYASGFGKIG